MVDLHESLWESAKPRHGGVTTTPTLAVIPCKFDLDLHPGKTYWNRSNDNLRGKLNADLPRGHAARPAEQMKIVCRSRTATSPINPVILLAPSA